MRFSIKNISLTFAAGCVGGLANMFTVWVCGKLGLTAALGVHLAPRLSVPWLCNRLVWGGLWGFILLLPWKNLSLPARGLLFSLAPSLVQLLVVFPHQAHQGMLGLELGYLTPVLVLFFNAVWGLAAAIWLEFSAAR